MTMLIELLINHNIKNMASSFRVLYWTDAGSQKIFAATDDGRYQKTIVTGNQFAPMAIAVNPKAG